MEFNEESYSFHFWEEALTPYIRIQLKVVTALFYLCMEVVQDSGLIIFPLYPFLLQLLKMVGALLFPLQDLSCPFENLQV
jgi:hypothetical protein